MAFNFGLKSQCIYAIRVITQSALHTSKPKVSEVVGVGYTTEEAINKFSLVAVVVKMVDAEATAPYPPPLDG